MQDPITISPRRPNRHRTHVEIYLPQQVLVVFTDDKPTLDRPHLERRARYGRTTTGKEWCERVTISTPMRTGTRTAPSALKDGRCGMPRRRAASSAFNRTHDGIRQWPARRHVQPGVLQLRHRRPRRKRAAAGLARLHPDQPRSSPSIFFDSDRQQKRHGRPSPGVTRSTCSTAWRSPSSTARRPAPSRTRCGEE